MASPVVRVRVIMAQGERQDKLGYLRRGAHLQRERRMFLQGVHHVSINAVRACRFSVVSLDIFREDISK
jgi:hypothetical protein